MVKLTARFKKKYGITLEVIRTAGSAENLELLSADDGGDDVVFLQGGIRPLGRSDGIISMGSLYYEPLWIFQIGRSGVRHLSDLKGKRVAVGLEGSGTKVPAMHKSYAGIITCAIFSIV